MQLPEHVFREYDIRGHASRDLTDVLVRALGRAVATFLGREAGSKGMRVAVARDCRLSSERLFKALSDGLRASGAEVLDLGVGPTPLAYFAAHQLEPNGSVMITGSHNPAEDNGFKMTRGKAPLFGDDIQTLREIMASERFAEAERGALTPTDLSDAYVAEIVRATPDESARSKVSLVLDAGNGAAGPLALRSFGALNMSVDPIFCEMDGRFPNHHPDPTVEKNLEALKERVISTGADLGIAFDGDGDRLGVVDDTGDVIWGDKLMIILSRALLAEHPGATILGEVKCSDTLFADIAAHGGRPLICRTGHSLIKQRMKEEGALLAGEMSGHIFIADQHAGYDDAIYAAARLVTIFAQSGKTPRQLLADVPKTSVTPEIRIPCPDELKFAVVDRVLAHYRSRREVLDVDGVRINFGDGAWGLCRASNTGPILVLRFEAQSDARRDEIRQEVEAVVAEARQSQSTP